MSFVCIVVSQVYKEMIGEYQTSILHTCKNYFTLINYRRL